MREIGGKTLTKEDAISGLHVLHACYGGIGWFKRQKSVERAWRMAPGHFIAWLLDRVRVNKRKLHAQIYELGRDEVCRWLKASGFVVASKALSRVSATCSTDTLRKAATKIGSEEEPLESHSQSIRSKYGAIIGRLIDLHVACISGRVLLEEHALTAIFLNSRGVSYWGACRMSAAVYRELCPNPPIARFKRAVRIKLSKMGSAERSCHEI